jgi:hypothetical protein
MKLPVTFCALILMIGPTIAIAENQSGAANGSSEGTGAAASDSGSSYSAGNPSPNNKVGDHPSSGDDKRGYSSDDAAH